MKTIFKSKFLLVTIFSWLFFSVWLPVKATSVYYFDEESSPSALRGDFDSIFEVIRWFLVAISFLGLILYMAGLTKYLRRKTLKNGGYKKVFILVGLALIQVSALPLSVFPAIDSSYGTVAEWASWAFGAMYFFCIPGFLLIIVSAIAYLVSSEIELFKKMFAGGVILISLSFFLLFSTTEILIGGFFLVGLALLIIGLILWIIKKYREEKVEINDEGGELAINGTGHRKDKILMGVGIVSNLIVALVNLWFALTTFI